jgi:hypothetical protein
MSNKKSSVVQKAQGTGKSQEESLEKVRDNSVEQDFERREKLIGKAIVRNCEEMGELHVDLLKWLGQKIIDFLHTKTQFVLVSYIYASKNQHGGPAESTGSHCDFEEIQKSMLPLVDNRYNSLWLKIEFTNGLKEIEMLLSKLSTIVITKEIKRDEISLCELTKILDDFISDFSLIF